MNRKFDSGVLGGSGARGSRALRVILLALVVALSGCVRHYVLTLSNGQRLDTVGKPRLQNGYYAYKDGLGRPCYVGAGRVTEIAPQSLVNEQKFNFGSKPGK